MEPDLSMPDVDDTTWEYEQWTENGLQKAKDIISDTDNSKSGDKLNET